MAAAASTVAQLAGGPSDRAAAYSALEGTRDAALAASCAEALVAVLGMPASEVDGTEWRRCSLVLAHLAQIDPVRVGGECYKELRALSTFAEGNAADAILQKPLEHMTKDDARTLAAGWAGLAAMAAKGSDPVFAAAGVGAFELLGAWATKNLYATFLMPEDDRNLRVMELTLAVLREDRSELSEAEVCGAWYLLAFGLIQGRAAVGLYAVQSGAVALAVAELRRSPPADWISVSQTPSGKFGAVLCGIQQCAVSCPPEHLHLVAATPRLLDVFLDVLKSYEAAGPRDADHTAVVYTTAALASCCDPLFAFSEVNRTAVRGAASSIRFLLGNPLASLTDIGMTTASLGVRKHVIPLV